MTHVHVTYDSPNYIVTSLGYGAVEIASKVETPTGRRATKAVLLQGDEASHFRAELSAASTCGMEHNICSAYDEVMQPIQGDEPC